MEIWERDSNGWSLSQPVIDWLKEDGGVDSLIEHIDERIREFVRANQLTPPQMMLLRLHIKEELHFKETTHFLDMEETAHAK